MSGSSRESVASAESILLKAKAVGHRFADPYPQVPIHPIVRENDHAAEDRKNNVCVTRAGKERRINTPKKKKRPVMQSSIR